MTTDATLCGIPASDVTRYRHHFPSRRKRSCQVCRAKTKAALTEPCIQEQLQARVQTAVPEALRNELIAALTTGANVTLWINGTADRLAPFYASLDGLVEGAEPVATALDTSRPISLARVANGTWEFIIILPLDDTAPVIARATSDT